MTSKANVQRRDKSKRVRKLQAKQANAELGKYLATIKQISTEIAATHIAQNTCYMRREESVWRQFFNFCQARIVKDKFNCTLKYICDVNKKFDKSLLRIDIFIASILSK